MERPVGVGGFVTVSLEEPEDRFPSKHPTDLRQIKKKEKRKCQRGVKSARLCRRPCCRDDVMQKSFSNSSAALTRVDVGERDCVGMSGIRDQRWWILVWGEGDWWHRAAEEKKNSLSNTKNSWWIDFLICFSLTSAINLITLCHKSSTTTLSSDVWRWTTPSGPELNTGRSEPTGRESEPPTLISRAFKRLSDPELNN